MSGRSIHAVERTASQPTSRVAGGIRGGGFAVAQYYRWRNNMRLALQIAIVLLPMIAVADTNEPSTEITLRPPISLDELIVWRDGGSLGFKLSDSDQHHVAFCVDARIGSSTGGYFFLGVTHAMQSGAHKLDLGGETEMKLLSYLEDWLAANFTREQLAAISATKDVGSLSKDEFKAWHVFRLVTNRAKPRERARAQPDKRK